MAATAPLTQPTMSPKTGSPASVNTPVKSQETPAAQLLESLQSPALSAAAAGHKTAEATDWLTRNRNFLEAKGWIEAGSNEAGMSTWNDPLGTDAKPQKVDAVVVKTRGGGKETIQQLRIAPLPWVYGMDEALAVQRARDRAALANVG